MLLNENVGDVAENLLAHTVVEAGHDRENDDQRRHPEGHTGDGDEGNDRDKGLLALGPQVAQADEPLVTHEDFREG